MPRSLIKSLFSENPDFRVRIFNTLGFLGFMLGIVFGVFSLFNHPGIASVIFNFSASAFAAAVIWRANKTGNFKRYFLMTVVVVFFIVFPILFFVGGGYTSGMPSFFIFAVVFTVIMLEEGRRAVFTTLEIVLYFGCFMTARFFPESVSPFLAEADMAKDIIVACLASSVVLAIAIYQHIVVYDRKQKELEEANAALQQIDRVKTEFLSNISHELKTPLTVISSYAQLTGKALSEQPGSELAEQHMKLIESEAERLSLMVSQILDVARIEENRLNIHARPCGLTEVIQNALDTYYPVFRKNRNKLVFDASAETPNVLCDPDRITQVIVNLISNAARHTQNGVITVRVSADEGFAVTEVTDTGAGMSPDQLAHAFDRYHAFGGAEKTDDARNTGTGLGLYICRHIINEHGGETTIQSEVGKGSAVRFSLPLSEEP
jgi:signal transduction histidine kinase